MQIETIKTFAGFCGSGAGAKGMNEERTRMGNMEGVFQCIGGFDVDAAAVRDFEMLAKVKGTVLDGFSLDQYRAFHQADPPPGWREATPQDMHRAAGHQSPDVVFLSAPCKGLSGLLSKTLSLTGKYQALNQLTVRGVWLTLEAWADNPPSFYLFENVPMIAARGRHLLDQIVSMLRHYGYAVAETTHDCGELGNLAQSRKRFLLVARHQEKVPPFLYEPEKRPLRGVGEVLGAMPLPGDLRAGPMHRIPRLQWKTWVRLALVKAGKDWRSLNDLAVENGHLRDYLIVPEMNNGVLGVNPWTRHLGAITSRGMPSNGNFAVADPRQQLRAAGYGVTEWTQPSGTVAGESLPSNGRFAVADIRFGQSAKWHDGQAYGVRRWEESTGAIAGQQAPGQGAYAVADPRHAGTAKHNNEFHIVPWPAAAGAVTSAHGTGQCVADPRPGVETFGKYTVTHHDVPAGTIIAGSTTGQGAFAVADPRPPGGPLFGKYKVTAFGEPAGVVISGDDQGAYAVADPRPGLQRVKGDNYLTGGHYGVVPWAEASGAVSASANHDNGKWSVADPRDMPALADKLTCRIVALDGTWHRPFTTLELAALQGFLTPEEAWSKTPFKLDGDSDQAWRERIGNAVPPPAAKAIAGVIGTAILLARAGGETFKLSATPVWVKDVAIAISVAGA